MSAEAAITRKWTVGPRTCTLSMPAPKLGAAIHAVLEWAPDQPARLTGEEWNQYRIGRAIALSQIAEEFAIPMAVLDLL